MKYRSTGSSYCSKQQILIHAVIGPMLKLLSFYSGGKVSFDDILLPRNNKVNNSMTLFGRGYQLFFSYILSPYWSIQLGIVKQIIKTKNVNDIKTDNFLW